MFRKMDSNVARQISEAISNQDIDLIESILNTENFEIASSVIERLNSSIVPGLYREYGNFHKYKEILTLLMKYKIDYHNGEISTILNVIAYEDIDLLDAVLKDIGTFDLFERQSSKFSYVGKSIPQIFVDYRQRINFEFKVKALKLILSYESSIKAIPSDLRNCTKDIRNCLEENSWDHDLYEEDHDLYEDFVFKVFDYMLKDEEMSSLNKRGFEKISPSKFETHNIIENLLSRSCVDYNTDVNKTSFSNMLSQLMQDETARKVLHYVSLKNDYIIHLERHEYGFHESRYHGTYKSKETFFKYYKYKMSKEYTMPHIINVKHMTDFDRMYYNVNENTESTLMHELTHMVVNDLFNVMSLPYEDKKGQDAFDLVYKAVNENVENFSIKGSSSECERFAIETIQAIKGYPILERHAEMIVKFNEIKANGCYDNYFNIQEMIAPLAEYYKDEIESLIEAQIAKLTFEHMIGL